MTETASTPAQKKPRAPKTPSRFIGLFIDANGATVRVVDPAGKSEFSDRAEVHAAAASLIETSNLPEGFVPERVLVCTIRDEFKVQRSVVTLTRVGGGDEG